MKRLLPSLAVVLAACATAGSAARTPQAPAAAAHPEPDPACRGNLAQSLSVSGPEQVVVKVGVSREGKVAFLDVLTPGLDTAGTLELRRALEGCLWKPAVGPNGERVDGSLTLAIHR